MQWNCIFMPRMGADYSIEFNQMEGDEKETKNVFSWCGAVIRGRENDKVNGAVCQAFFILRINTII